MNLIEKENKDAPYVHPEFHKVYDDSFRSSSQKFWYLSKRN